VNRPSGTAFAVAGVGLIVGVTAVISALYLASTGTSSDWIPVYQEVLKISFQALAIGALGGLVKLILDRRRARGVAAAERRKARELDATELRDRRYRFITSLVELARAVDEARLVIRANRSVRSWTDMINDKIIPARSRLRNIIHELRNWKEAGSLVFEDNEGVIAHLQAMDGYLHDFLDEYANNKQELGEVQLWAEQARGKRHKERAERERLLNQIWNQMQGLKVLGDLIKDEGGYGAYRESYLGALLIMRQSLTTKGPHHSR
jgi:hypothetical protein